MIRRITIPLTLAATAFAHLALAGDDTKKEGDKPAEPAPGATAAPSAAPAPAPAPRPAKDVDPASLAKARGYFEAGAKFYEESEFDKAIQLFEQAYSTAPRDGILFSLAQAHRRAFGLSGRNENLAKAIEYYEKYTQVVSEGGRRSEALRALAELRLTARGLDLTQPTRPEEKPRTTVIVNIFAEGTTVSIDGGPPKRPPIDEPVTPGRHKVKLSAPGYFDVEKTIDIEEGRIALANFEQKERPGRLLIDAEDGTEVSVDGRFIAETPLAAPIELPSGAHFVAVTKNGHASLVREVDIAPGKDLPVPFEMTSTSQRDISIVMLTGAGVLAATAGVFLGLTLASESDATAILDARERTLAQNGAGAALTPNDAADYEDARDRRGVYTGVFVGTAAAAGVVGLLGLGLFVFDKPRPVEAPKVEREEKTAPKPGQDMPLDMSLVPVVTPYGAAGVVRGRF